jgi:hypothetical protein
VDANNPVLSDPVELVRQLDAEAIRQRIERMDREREARIHLGFRVKHSPERQRRREKT